MRENGDANYFHLNRDNCWPSFQQVGLDLRLDGAWQLAAVPLSAGVSPAEIADQPAPSGPAGVAVGPDGSVYYSQSEAHSLRVLDARFGEDHPLLCLGGEGDHPAQLRHPRGLLYHPIRHALFVADSGNHRIQIFDPETIQLLEIWGQPDPGGEPEPGDAAGRFAEPWSLANDAAGNVYVVDRGNKRVQRFDLRGQVQPHFEQNSAPHLTQPAEVAVAGEREETRIYVLDTGQNTIVVLDANGHRLGEFGAPHPQSPLGMAASDGAVYVGDNRLRRLLKFKAGEDDSFTFIGAAHGYEGPVAALAVEDEGTLWLHPGGELAPVPLQVGRAHVKSGVLWGGPFGAGDQPVQWHRLKAMAHPLHDGAHLRFFVHTGEDAQQPPTPPALEASEPFYDQDWDPLPPDLLDGLIGARPARYLWLGAHFSGEGIQSPVLEQIKITFDHATYRQHLPAIYSKEPTQRDWLDRFLALFESVFDDTESEITHLGQLLDPDAAPAAWLPWLASWMALDLDENWSETQQREAIADALSSYARRGTAEGLRESLHHYAGVDAHIEEPIVHAGWWALPASEAAAEPELRNALLGFTTMLAPVEADGAVVGTTAILDHVHLITQDEFGAPLFENMAHQFTVQVYRGQAKDLDRIRAIVEAEKPAHTTYQLCIIEPRMRVGFQARLGIDTVVAGPAPGTRLGKTPGPAADVTLGGQPPGQIGERSQVGVTTRLSGTR